MHDFIIAAMVARWQRGDRPVESRDVYADLVADGITVPEGVMDGLLRSLDQQGWVIVFHQPYRDALAQHGDAAVTWIGEQWLGTTLSARVPSQAVSAVPLHDAQRQRRKSHKKTHAK